PARFAQLVAAAAPRLRFDAWAHHPYPATDLQRPDAQQSWPAVGLSSLDRFTSRLAGWFHRREMRLWLTEFAYRSSPLPATYLQQALTIARAEPNVDMFIWFRFRDAAGERWPSGVVDRIGRAKPALASFAAAARCYRLVADPCIEEAKLTVAGNGGVSSF